MKKIIYGILIFMLLGSFSAFAQVYLGMEAPEIDAAEWINTSDDISLESLRGKVVVLEFWATWCGPCRSTIPHLIELNNEYKNQGVVFLSLTDEDRNGAGIDEFMESMGMNYIVGTGSNTSYLYGVSGIPHAIVINRDGLIVWQGHPANDLESGIQSALSGEAPPEPQEMMEIEDINLEKVDIGQIIEGKLDSSDGLVYGQYVDGYVIETPAETTVDVSITSSDFDTMLGLIDSNGMEYSNDDAEEGDMPNSTDSLYTYNFSDSGKLNIYVTSFDSGEKGAYTLEIKTSTREGQNLPQPGLEEVELETVDMGTTEGILEISDSLINGYYIDGYKFKGFSGMTLNISLTSNEFDTVLEMRDPNGISYGNDDADMPMLNSTNDIDSFYSYTFPSEEELLIYVFSFYEEEMGSYTLTLEVESDK